MKYVINAFITVCCFAGTLDYEEELLGLLFRSGQEKQCANITILDDELPEELEVFNVTLTTEASRVILNPDHAVVDISDNDGKE